MDESNGAPPRPPINTDDWRARIQSLRNIISDPHRHTTTEQQVALRALDSEEQDRLDDLNRDRPRTLYTQSNQDADSLFDSQPSTSPASMVRVRRQIWRARERRDRERNRIERLARDDTTAQPGSVSPSTSSLHISRARRASYDREDQSNQPREGRPPKRRKLEDGTADETPIVTQYGLEGTLLPGNLLMHVLDTPDSSHTLSPEDERIKHKLPQACNRETFRSKKPNLSLLMKHRSGWPFSLSKIVIKVPRSDYEFSPLQGMVFVSMDDDLQHKTSYYDNLSPANYKSHQAQMYDSYHPSYAWANSSVPRNMVTLPYAPRPSQTSEPPEPVWTDPHSEHDELLEVDTQPLMDASIERLLPDPSEMLHLSYTPPPWQDAQVEYRRYAGGAYRHSRLPAYGIPTEDIESDQHSQDDELAHDSVSEDQSTSSGPEDEDAPTYLRNTYRHANAPAAQDYNFNQGEYRHQTIRERMQERRDRGEGTYTPLPMLPRMYRHDHRSADSSSVAHAIWNPPLSAKRLPGCSELLAGRHADATEDRIMPHATFQIVRDGSVGVTINLDPEVAGKYVMVKLWSQCPNGSVNVTNVIPYGFSGMRQMPDLSFRD